LIADLQEESEDKTRVAFLDHPTLTAPQMIREITRQLTLGKVSRDKIHNLNLLREHLKKLKEEGYKAIAIVDEGQMLAHRPDLLQELRILLNLCSNDSFLLTFIFSGQKALEGAIQRMPEFWQHLPVRFFLGNLNINRGNKEIKGTDLLCDRARSCNPAGENPAPEGRPATG
jgi:type II secretory pathway predicted ATPase ExeA